MEKKLILFFSTVIILFFVACPQPEYEDDYDKNTMKGEWEFISATDGVSYGNITITNIGTASTATYYENIWPHINIWDGLRETFAVIVENDDLKNIIFDIPLYVNQEKTIELLECSSAIGGTMKFKNWTDSITYTYERYGN